MDHDRLLIHTLDDLAAKLEPGPRREYNLLRAAAILRQLLIDGKPLLHEVNRHYRMKIRFKVASQTLVDDSPSTFFATGRLAPERTSVEVDLDGLLEQVLVRFGDLRVTVRDAIRHHANVAGGVHLGKPESDAETYLAEQTARQAATGHIIVPSAGVMILDIARVVIAGLEPLRRRIETRVPVRSERPRTGPARRDPSTPRRRSC